MPYEEYFENASEGLVIVNPSGEIVEVNRKAESLFGYSEKELIGERIELLVPERLRERHQSHLKRYFAAPRSRPMGVGLQLAARRKDASEFPVEISLTYAGGTKRGDLVVAAITDVSERLTLERELRRAETVVSLGTLAAGVAHDLNNPLQVIRSTAELLLDSPGLAGELSEDYQTILRQAQRASAIVEEFLALSRRRANSYDKLNLNEIVDHALLLTAEPLRRAGIRIASTLGDGLPEIRGDVTALERVLINLVTNARDAMPQGGSMAIATGRLDQQPGWIYVNVTDSGCGISQDELSKIFNLMYTTKSNGTGLGLWLSRRIIHEHNGKLEVHSEPGMGATFTVKLPAEDSSEI